MKAHKIEIVVLNQDEMSEEDIKLELEQGSRYLFTSVMSVKTIDITDWTDDHPLNQTNKSKAEVDEIFKNA